MASVQTFLNSFSNKLEHPVRQHLKNVYACLAMSTLAAAGGASLHIFTNILSAGILSTIGGLIFFSLLMFTNGDDAKTMQYRMGYLLGFSTCTGVGLGPLLEHAFMINPSILITAFIGTFLVFGSFSICALLSERGSWLYLGGMLSTMLSTLIMLTFANIFFGSTLLFEIRLYLGLAVMCGFVLYDTQLIVEKRRRGDKDFVRHSVDLFIDMIGIFKRLLIILSNKEQDSQKKRKN